MKKQDKVIFCSISDISPVSTRHGVGEKRIIACADSVGEPFTQIAKTVLKTGDYVDVHTHPTMSEHFFILEGKCIVFVGDKEYPCCSGDYLFLPADVPHSISVLIETTMITIGVAC